MHESTWSPVLRFLAAANCIIGVVVSIIFSWSAFGGRWGNPLAFILILIMSLLGVFLFSAAFMALAEVADNVAATRYNTEQLFRSHERAQKETADVSKTAVQNTPTIIPRSPISKDGWRCTKCDEKNKPLAVNCRSCGEYR